MSFRSIDSDSLMFDKFGVVTGSASVTGTVTQFVDEESRIIRFKADAGNGGVFLLGEAGSGLTSFPLEAGDEVEWNASNLNKYIHTNVSGTMDYLYWWVRK